MTDADRIEATTRRLIASAREAGAIVTGDFRISELTAAALLGLTPGGLKNLRHEGGAPTAYRVPINGCRVSYRIDDLAAWLESRIFR